jgi:WD40 repeat protein
MSVGLSGDGKRALTGSQDKTAILWDAYTGEALTTFSGHEDSVLAVALTVDGRHVFSASSDGTARRR